MDTSLGSPVQHPGDRQVPSRTLLAEQRYFVQGIQGKCRESVISAIILRLRQSIALYNVVWFTVDNSSHKSDEGSSPDPGGDAESAEPACQQCDLLYRYCRRRVHYLQSADSRLFRDATVPDRWVV